MNQIVAPKLQSVSKYPSALLTSVCGREGKAITFYIVITRIILICANKQAGNFVTRIRSCVWV